MMPTHLAINALLLTTFLLAGCQRAPVPRQEGSGYSALKPLTDAAPEPQRIRQLVYVPVYSSIYWGFDQQTIDLAATLSIRNVNLKQPLVIRSVKYFDSSGREIGEFVPNPSSLAPMATADFVIQRRDTAGGPGANFLVEWSSPVDVDEPVIEAVMVGQHGNAGLSFVSPGRALPKASSALAPTR